MSRLITKQPRLRVTGISRPYRSSHLVRIREGFVVGLGVSAVLALGLGVLRALPVWAQEFQESPVEVIRWAERAASQNSGLRQKLLELDATYEILFIPGIMGSRLKIGDFIWGESRVEADRLALDPSLPLAEPPSVLETFEARDRIFGRRWTRQDIYGSGIDRLNTALGGREPRLFGYDWREDLDKVADTFQQFAERELRGKKVLVVAHSMGGLMFWHWKNRHPIEQRPFTLLALILLGSPLEGTCEIARMLINGYQPYDGASGFENFAYDLIFRNAHAAMFTFPSVFELLWKGRSCAALKLNGSFQDQDLLLLDFWKRRFRDRFREFAKSTRMPGATDDEKLRKYEERVGHAVAKAREFRLALDRRQGKDSVYYLFSSKLEMPMRYLLVVEGGSLKVHGKERIVKGDGRVPKESAVNKEFREIGTGHIYALDAGHGELLSDPKFTEFIDEVELIIQRDKALEIGAYVAADADLRRQLSAERFLISPTPAGVSPISVSEADKKAVASLNLETIAPLAEEASPRAAKKAGRELEDDARNTAAARVVYRSGDVLSAEATDARTLNRLGYILYREKKFSEAAAVLKKAAERAESTKDPYLTDELKGKIYGNLGTALFHAGFLGEARKAYEKGAAKGNPIAQYNLGLLMKLRTPAE